MTLDEAIDLTTTYNVAGAIGGERRYRARAPFCFPHHTLSHAALVGYGGHARPGGESLEHNGVLFLDELRR